MALRPVLVLTGLALAAAALPVADLPTATARGATAAAAARLAASAAGAPAADGAAAANASAAAGVGGLAGELVPEAEAMIAWIRAAGGEVNVAVRHTPGGGRTTFAPRDFVDGDVLAKIPLSICYVASTKPQAEPAAAAKLLADMADPASPHAPYLAVLPPRRDVWSLHNFPPAYLPLIQHNDTEWVINATQAQLARGWAALGPPPGVGLGELAYAMSLRSASGGRSTVRAAHAPRARAPAPARRRRRSNDCPHTHPKEPCAPGSAEECIVWRAREGVAAGAEVCNAYRFMLNDRSLLQYGFLVTRGPVSSQLSGIDRHDFNPATPWGDEIVTGQRSGPVRFEGQLPEVTAEVARLQARLQHLSTGDAAATAARPDPSDADGDLLGQLLAWRAQRKATMQAEVERLRRMAARLEADEAARRAGAAPAATQAAYDDLGAWLAAEGAQVNVAVRPSVAGSADAVGEGCAEERGAAALAAAPSGVFTSGPVPEGGLLAAIPLNATVAPAPGNDGLLDLAVQLMLDLHALHTGGAPAAIPGSNSTLPGWRAFLASLPPLGAAHGVYSVPRSYLPVVQHPQLERHILAAQVLLFQAFDRARAALDGVDDTLTLREAAHAANLLGARLVGYEGGSRVVPLLAHANPALSAGCPHADYVGPCPGAGGELCVHWVAGAPLPAGAEVCVALGHLLPDAAVLQFGAALADEGGELQLLGMDRHDFNPAAPFAASYESPPAFTGTAAQALDEVARLASIHANLTAPAAAAAAAAVQPVAHDAGGALLARLRALRSRRIAGLEAEIGRLMRAHHFSSELVAHAADERISDTAPAQPLAACDAGAGDAWARMLCWMRLHGAKVNVEVRDVSAAEGRAVFATADMQRGDLLAAIPLDLTWSHTAHGGAASYELSAANLWAMMAAQPPSLLAPYFDALPRRDELVCPLAHAAAEYLPLLQSAPAEHFVAAYQQRLRDFWASHADTLQGAAPGMTREDLIYARALMSTRLFAHGSRGELLIPLLDMANHRNDCPHTLSTEPCPGDDARECLMWRAGDAVRAGGEVCNQYQHLLQDRSVLQYGFMQASTWGQARRRLGAQGAAAGAPKQRAPPRLARRGPARRCPQAYDARVHGLDRHDFSEANGFWAAYAVEGGPDDFDGAAHVPPAARAARAARSAPCLG
ncbi:hypothetical protein HT031_006815 [Scenedesmus sp. PABB004]|nr:hypothetical protein HT031_006815 [Scenedesmus sp. PABB004]